MKEIKFAKKETDYVKEYVDETGEPQRKEFYKITKEHYDKALYLLDSS